MSEREDGASDEAGSDRGTGPGARAAREAELWRMIVDNFGERARLDDPPADPGPEPPGPSSSDHAAFDGPPDVLWTEEHFVPPDPGPTPLPEPRRLLAWLGVIAVPAAVILLAVLQMTVPDWAVVLLLCWFLGGFGYLVLHMRRSEPDDGDDGARL